MHRVQIPEKCLICLTFLNKSFKAFLTFIYYRLKFEIAKQISEFREMNLLDL